jgi:hypothetical protein
MTNDKQKETGSISNSKVAKLIDEYDMEGTGDKLFSHWTATGEDHWSLRDMADYFNKKILRTTLRDAGVQSVSGELENIYRLMTEEDVSTADRTQLRRRLDREGVDTEKVKDDFVTYQAIRSYVKEYRGGEYNPDHTDRIETERKNIQKIRGRMISVIENTIDQLRKTDRIQLGDFRVLVDIQILCDDCHSQFGISELLTKGGCKCNEDS